MDGLHFSEDFCIYQATIDEYKNLQIPKEKRNLLKVDNKTLGQSICRLDCFYHTTLAAEATN